MHVLMQIVIRARPQAVIKGPLAHAGFVCCHEGGGGKGEGGGEGVEALAWLIAGPFLIRRQPSNSSVSDFFFFFRSPEWQGA